MLRGVSHLCHFPVEFFCFLSILFFCATPLTIDLCVLSFDRFLNQYKGVYERDVKCQVKMSRNSGIVAQGPHSPSKDEVRNDPLQDLSRQSDAAARRDVI